MYNIIQGGRTDHPANPFYVRLKSDPLTMDPFDLTGVTALTACFHNTDGSRLSLSLSAGISVVGNPLLGKLLLAMTAAQTALLAVSEASELELSLVTSGDPVKIAIPNAYSVEQSDC